MTEVEALKIRAFDLSEQLTGLQGVLGQISELSGFKGNNTADLVKHLKDVVTVDEGEPEKVITKVSKKK